MPGEQTLACGGTINVAAGDGNDTIALGGLVGLKGSLDGGLGTDTLDFTSFAEAAAVNRGLGTSGVNAARSGDQEVPPSAHAATGAVSVTNYDPSTRTFDISVGVTGLAPADVTAVSEHGEPLPAVGAGAARRSGEDPYRLPVSIMTISTRRMIPPRLPPTAGPPT